MEDDEEEEEEEDMLMVMGKWKEGGSERWVKKDCEVLVSFQDDCYILKEIEDPVHPFQALVELLFHIVKLIKGDHGCGKVKEKLKIVASFVLNQHVSIVRENMLWFP